MTSERLRRIHAVFDEARERPPAQRQAFLDDACRGDPDLRAEVESLLECLEQADDGFLSPQATVPGTIRCVLQRAADVFAGTSNTDDVDPLIGQQVGSFRVQRLIAVGGMARVYQAVQTRPHRVVALKVMQLRLGSKDAVRRFEFEAETLARMQHPHIAQIFEAGTTKIAGVRVPYFAMEYIPQARSLIEHARAAGLSVRQRLELFALVCDAVHHGHTKGVVHRDLKPSNILVDADGRPKVIDFGVARATDGDLTITRQTDTGQLVGTLRYMSPEQCDGDPDRIDTRSDVYALGVVLYELLTGTLPYPTDGRTAWQLLAAIREQDIRRLSAADRSLRGDIETIVHKALAKDPRLRYESAAELAADIRRYLRGEPISARKPSLWYVASRYARRHRAAVAGVAGIFAVLVAAVVVSSLLASWARSEQHRAEVQAAMAQLGLAQARLAEFDPGSARTALEQVRPRLRGWAWRHLQSRLDQSIGVLRLPGGPPGPRSLSLSADGRRLALVRVQESQRAVLCVYDVKPDRQAASVDALLGLRYTIRAPAWAPTALSRDGRYLVHGTPVPSSMRTRWLCLWDLDHEGGPRLIGTWATPMRESIVALTFDRRRDVLAVASDQGRIALVALEDLIHTPGPFRLEPDAEVKQLSERAPVLPVRLTLTGLMREAYPRFSADGHWLAAGATDHLAAVWDVRALPDSPDSAATRAPAALLVGHRDHVLGVAFSPDATCLATASVDQTIRLWDLRSLTRREAAATRPEEPLRLKSVGILTGHTAPVRDLVFDADGRRLYSVAADRTLRVWEIAFDRPVMDIRARITGHATHYRLLRTLWGHVSGIWSLVRLNSGLLVTTSGDGTIRLWLPGRQPVPTTAAHYSSVVDAAWTRDGRYLITLDSRFCVHVWDAETLAPLARAVYPAASGASSALAVWPWGRGRSYVVALASSGSQPWFRPQPLVRLYLLRPEVGRLEYIASIGSDPPQPLISLALSRDHRTLAAGTTAGRVLQIDVTDPRQPRVVGPAGGLRVAEGWVEALVFLDPQGRWLLTGEGYTTGPRETPAPRDLRIWDLDQGRCVATRPAHQDRILALALSPDGQLVASASADRTVRLWRLRWRADTPRLTPDGRPLQHEALVASVTFHPREPLIVTATGTSQLLLWNLDERTPIASFSGLMGTLTAVRFDPTGTRLAVASGGVNGADNAVCVYETRPPGPDLLWKRARTLRARELIDELFWDPDVRTVEAYRQRLLQLARRSRDPLTRRAAARAAEQIRLWLPHPEWYARRAEHVLRPDAAPDPETIRSAIVWVRLALELAPDNDLYLSMLRRLEAIARQAGRLSRPAATRQRR